MTHGQLSFRLTDLLEADDELDSVYAAWRKAVNMSASELQAWSNDPCSRKASLDPAAVIKRNLNLLNTPKDQWGPKEVADAKRPWVITGSEYEEELQKSFPGRFSVVSRRPKFLKRGEVLVLLWRSAQDAPRTAARRETDMKR